MAGRWSTSMFNWLGFYSSLRWSSGGSLRDPTRLLRWPDLSFSIVDDVMWSLITAFESVALVSMLCFFFLFCGCTV
ncbi:hypothetical protein M5689_023833 [Euphorbia peplus]|nr:hypothetical protein M5689_023833 [Euphorbia peplus]